MNNDDIEGLDEATRKKIEELQKVTREEDGCRSYASAQMAIGEHLAKNNKLNNALVVWNNVKHSDNSRIFNDAQIEIGKFFSKSGNESRAIEIWENIERLYSKSAYAKANFYIGIAFYKKNDIKNALLSWREVDKEDDLVFYSRAQLNIGMICKKENHIDDALSAWKKVGVEVGKELYGKVKINIGSVLIDKNEIESGLKVWSLLTIENSSPYIYALAQLNTGIVLENNSKFREALEVWENIKIEHDKEVYAKAMLNSGFCFLKKECIEEALRIWVDNINYEYDKEIYAKAQIAIGSTIAEYYEKNCIKIWKSVKFENSPQMYAIAQYKIGENIILEDDFSKYDEAKVAFKNAKSAYPYEAYCYQKICELLLDPDLKVVGERVLNLLNATLAIVKILQLDFGDNTSNVELTERKLAHYTNISIANILLENNEEDSDPNYFRLNTINNVNDPSEGHLLVNYLNNISQSSFYAPDFDKSLHAFISCFTFNHDSLNQFRLYGKEDNKEASGVSLVFKKDFFQFINDLDGLSFISFDNDIQNPSEHYYTSEVYGKLDAIKDSGDDTRVSKQPVMRCVYIDPNSHYIQLAQRNRITFFREFGDETIVLESGIVSKAEHEWEKYNKYINEKTNTFSDKFCDLKKTYQSILEEKKQIENNDLDLSNRTDNLVNEILLPLKYLIKHSAFQEEQECRMIYVTSLNAPEVKMVDKKFLFVEYQADVKGSLDKVYIAPAARDYQMYLAWLLRDKDIKIELSNNPYRQT